MNIQLEDDYGEMLRVHRGQRIAEMRRRKKKQRFIRRVITRLVLPAAVFLTVVIFIISKVFGGKDSESSKVPSIPNTAVTAEPIEEFVRIPEIEEAIEEETGEEIVPANSGETKHYSAETTGNTEQFGGDIVSGHAILIDMDTGNIVARKGEKNRINPASMTKILTLLVAAEHIENLDDTFTITEDITDYGYLNDCSNAGFEKEEKVTIRDMMYGTILPSGADAAVGLATYVAGSQEAFVEMMNDKIRDLGLSETAHFTNCVGVYDKNHYCSTYDMAIIMAAAIDNELCREILSTRIYMTSETEQHSEGIELSNWFIRRIEDKDTGGKVLGGKTGYVLQSGNCAASFAADKNGKEYICVTVDASSGWRCIYDHVRIYKEFLT